MRGSAYGRAGQYRDALQDFDKAIAAQPEFLPGLFEPSADLPLRRRPGQGTGRLQPRHPDQRQLRRRLYRARRPLSEGRPYQGCLQRFPEGDPARHHRRARLSPPRPDLSAAGPAQFRDRGFLDRDLAVAGLAGTLQWPRRLLSRAERRGQRLRRLQHGDQAGRPVSPRAGPTRPPSTSGAATRRAPPSPMPGPRRSISTTSRPSRASPAPAAAGCGCSGRVRPVQERSPVSRVERETNPISQETT